MKIKSNFKDYYDYVAHQYGDPNIVYNRTKLVEDTPEGFEGRVLADYEDRVLDSYITGWNRPWWMRRDEKDFTAMSIFIAGFIYYFADGKFRSKVPASNKLIDISKELQAPVFKLCSNTYNPHTRDGVYGHVPVLGRDTDLPKHISTYEMYQLLAGYCANVLRDNPDTKPPVQVSDKDRIVQHGFDLKQSFRHRK